MVEYVTADFEKINFGATGKNEVIQNVRMIVATTMFSCPMFRDFAIDPSIVDAPLNIAQAKLTAQIVTAIKRYEPRAKVLQVSYEGDAIEGSLRPIVKVEILDDAI